MKKFGYATSHISDGVLPRGDGWNLFMVVEFKAWLAIWLYMEMKWQPNMKSYRMKEDLTFQCPTT